MINFLPVGCDRHRPLGGFQAVRVRVSKVEGTSLRRMLDHYPSRFSHELTNDCSIILAADEVGLQTSKGIASSMHELSAH